MAGEEGLAVSLVIPLVLLHHAIKPGKQLLGAVIGMQDNGHAVRWRDGPDVVGPRDCAGNGRFLVAVRDALPGNSRLSKAVRLEEIFEC